MSEAAHDRAEAATLPEGDVIRILLEQHARVEELLTAVQAADNAERKAAAFAELRMLLAAHETAEEMILRPVSTRCAGSDVTDARNHEESEANKVLAQLEQLEVGTPDFDTQFAAFAADVKEHAEAEEKDEFPAVVDGADEAERKRLGTMLLAVEKVAPTHPHPMSAGSPAAVWATGPFASLVDHARDAIEKLMTH